MTDTERLDALEIFIRKEPLTLWFGKAGFPGGKTTGLSMLSGRRSLREALDQCFSTGTKNERVTK